MRISPSSALVALLLAACGPGSPRLDAGADPSDAGDAVDARSDPRLAWVGAYEGTYEAVSGDCTTGDRVTSDPPRARTIELVIAPDGRLVVDVPSCPVPLDPTSDREAIVTPVECELTLSDGTPVHMTHTGGIARLTGADLHLETRVRLEYLGQCDDVAETFIGTRTD